MRLRFLIILIICLLANSTYSFAQTKAEKIRIAELENEPDSVFDVNKIGNYCELCRLYVRYNTSKALSYIEKAEKIANKDKEKMAVFEGFGDVYFYKKDYKKSLLYYEKQNKLAKKLRDNKNLAYSLLGMGNCYNSQKLYKKAVTVLNQSLLTAKKLKDNELKQKIYYSLYESYNFSRDYKKSLENYKLYVSCLRENELKENKEKIDEINSALNEISSSNDSLSEISKANAQEIELLNKEKEDLNRQNENLERQTEVQSEDLKLRQAEIDDSRVMIDKQRNLIWTFIIIGVIFLVLLAIVFSMFRKIKKINSRLENQKDEIEIQKNLIQVKNDQITDSINYARKIQDSILVPEQKIKRWLPQMFIYYKPKDIVSGDFYWFSKYESKYVITAIDCTGHGVPGAFLSMIGNTLLHEIVNIKHVFKPDQILSMLHDGITLALNQEEESASEDGMDMSLCTVDTKLHRFQFAGAKNNLYVVQGNKLKILKANYYSIGGKPLRPDMKVEFTCYDFMYDDNTSIYMFSDGYLDQYGGENNEKFNTARFKEMILANRELPMEEQKEILSKTMEEWKGDRQQIDDFLVMGVKLSDLNDQNEA